MYIYTCEPNWEALLSCIYVAWSSKRGHQNIKIEYETSANRTFLDEYIYVPTDSGQALSVIDAINTKISTGFYYDLSYCAMAYEPEVPDLIYRMMILGFAYGPEVVNKVQYEAVMRFNEIKKRVGNEAHRFVEFLRFHEVRKSMYVAHIEPKSRIAITLGGAFEDRMPSENWMIIDDIHKEAVIHPKNEHFYMRTLTDAEFAVLLETEKENDDYTDMWKIFFETIAIKERINPKLQRNLYPIWTRKHAPEFDSPSSKNTASKSQYMVD
ncbi:MAG: TIGR03915 family putative DNA repair protein [Lachnospiraceae bacterium]|nr:TIGR03915 family putative DNA repair protein [Lachnospiraceae bacterium]